MVSRIGAKQPFLLGRICKAGTVAQLLIERCDDRREGVSVNQRGEVGVQVKELPAVGIEQISAASVAHVAGNFYPRRSIRLARRR
jgi:hypothetical protein